MPYLKHLICTFHNNNVFFTCMLFFENPRPTLFMTLQNTATRIIYSNMTNIVQTLILWTFIIAYLEELRLCCHSRINIWSVQHCKSATVRHTLFYCYNYSSCRVRLSQFQNWWNFSVCFYFIRRNVVVLRGQLILLLLTYTVRFYSMLKLVVVLSSFIICVTSYLETYFSIGTTKCCLNHLKN